MAQVAFSFSSSKFIKVTSGASAAYLSGRKYIESIMWTGSTTKGQQILVKESLSSAWIFIQRAEASLAGYITPWTRPHLVQGLWFSMPGGTAIITLADGPV